MCYFRHAESEVPMGHAGRNVLYIYKMLEIEYISEALGEFSVRGKY